MKKLKIGDKIIIIDIYEVGGKRYWSSSCGEHPYDLQLPYETTVQKIKKKGDNDIYESFGDGTYGFWTEKTIWIFAEPNYEIF